MSNPKESIEHGRGLAFSPTDNPFKNEIALYEKKRLSSDIPVTVVVPDFYRIGMPNLGHQMVERQFNKANGFYADRAYLTDDYSLAKEDPKLKPEIIVVSMSYEGSYVRALRALDLLGCPPDKRDRKPGDPLVIAGGWSITKNPLPLFEMADVIGVGDSEHQVAAITDAYRVHRASRGDFLDAVVPAEGLIIPSRYKVETQDGYLTKWEAKNAPTEISASKSSLLPHSWYLSGETDYNTIGHYDGKTFFSMEIVDACRSKCAYCASGYKDINRDIQDPKLLGDLGEWAKGNGADLVKLFFPANSSVVGTKEIMKEMMARGLQPRVGSAKAEYLDREYIDLVGKSGQEKIAFAPETGDYELRKRLGKPGMTNDVLRKVITASVEAGIPNLDLYFVAGFPLEAGDTFQKTLDLIGEFDHLTKGLGMSGNVRVAMPNFFPKAGTPFQYAPSGDLAAYPGKIAALESGVGDTVTVTSMKGNVDLLSQNVMSRGGNEAGKLMLEVYNKLKAKERVTGQFTPDTFSDWREAMAALKISESIYFSEKSSEKPLPWEHIRSNSIGSDSLRKVWELFQQRRAPFA